MKRILPILALLAAVASPFPAFGAYVPGDLVWKCDFTPAEAARHELDGRRLSASGYGVAYEPDGGRDGDSALRFRTPDQMHTATIAIRPDVPLAGVLLVEADVRGVEIGPGLNSWNGPKVMLPYELPSKKPGQKGKTSYPQLPGELLLPGEGSPFEQPVYRVVGENGDFTFVPAYTQENIEETQRAAERALHDISETLESSLEDIRADVEEARAAAQSDAETAALDPFPDASDGDGAFPAPPEGFPLPSGD